VWIIAVILAGSYYIISNWDQMINFFKLVPKINIFYSAIFIVLGKLSLFLIAKYSIDKEGFDLPYSQVFFIVATTQLGKYIPGGVWHFVGRYNAYHDQDISLKKSTKAMISENFWLLGGAIAIGTLFGISSQLGKHLLSSVGLPTTTVWLIVYGLMIFIIWIAILITYESILKRKFTILDFKSIIKLISVQLITWIFLGTSFLFLIPNNTVAIASDVIFGYSFSWAIGYVMVFAPGGIGIREGALVWIFSNLFSSSDILIYSTVHRFLYVAVEFLLGIFALFIRRFLPYRKMENSV